MSDRELDALVAEKVMGWTLHKIPHLVEGQYGYISGVIHSYIGNRLIAPWSPSTDIAAAWQVVEKLRGREETWFEVGSGSPKSNSQWYAQASTFVPGGEWRTFTVRDAIAPRAICLAALKAVGAALPQDAAERPAEERK